MAQASQVYECVGLNALGECESWQLVNSEQTLPKLDETEQGQILLSILSVMVLVWLFKMLKKAL